MAVKRGGQMSRRVGMMNLSRLRKAMGRIPSNRFTPVSRLIPNSEEMVDLNDLIRGTPYPNHLFYATT
jgi:hypothetical protein